MAALTAYLGSTTDTLLTAAKQIVVAAPSSEVNVANTTKKLTGWGELQTVTGLSAWTAGSSEPAPSGQGSLWDVTTLEGQTIAAGTWTPSIKLASVGTATANIHVRAYKYNGGTYTLIGDFILTGQLISATATTYNPVAQSLSSVAFVTGDKLYIDYVCQITVAGTSTTGKIAIYENGGAAEQVVTPGYAPTPVSPPNCFTGQPQGYCGGW